MPWPTGPLVKGTLLLARKRYVQEQGEGVLQAVLDQLAPEDAHVLGRIILPSSWFSLGLLRRVEKAIVDVMAPRDRKALLLDIGRATATAALTHNGTERGYVRAGDPHFLLERAPCIYANHFNAGSRSYDRTGDRSGVVRTAKPFEDGEPDSCVITVGWFAAAIALAGGRSPRVAEVSCVASGARSCEMRCEWS